MPKQGVMQYRQSRTIHNEHQLVNNKSQPQLVDSSCQDNSVAFSEAMHNPQSETVQDQHQPDDKKYQRQLVDTSCLDNSEATSESIKYPRSENLQNQHCVGKPYLYLDIRTFQPQQVDSSHQESSQDQTSREELDGAINRQEDKQCPQWLIVPNQQQPCKPYPKLDIRTYQPQQVDTSRQESSNDPSSGKELVSTIDKVESGAVCHALAQLEDQHVEEAEDSVVLWNWIFDRLDPRPRIFSMIKCHMAGENLVVTGCNVNLTKVQIAERKFTPPDPVVRVTFSLKNVMPAYVGEFRTKVHDSRISIQQHNRKNICMLLTSQTIAIHHQTQSQNSEHHYYLR